MANICQLVASFGKSKLKHKDFMICSKNKESKTDVEKNNEVLKNFFFKGM